MKSGYSYGDLAMTTASSEKTTANFRTFEKVTRFCQMCTGRYSFWCCVAIFACLEPILCSRYPTLLIRALQAVVLGISTMLYIIQLIGVATREWEKIVVIEAMTRLGTISIRNPLKDFTALKLFVFFTAEGEYVLEGAMIVMGWILIFWRPGLATLRCFRVFRILWFYEVEVFKDTTVRLFSPYFGSEFVIRGFKVLKFAINALTALGNEMFRLTNETRGALLLIMMFFYSAFVLGATLLVETASNSDLCQSIGQCTWTLVRLTFFDGDGLDFAYYLTHDHRILFFIVMLYLCITSFGILNGLVGVFGTALARASHLAFEEDDEHREGDDGLNGSMDDLESELDREAEMESRARRGEGEGGEGGEEGGGGGGGGGESPGSGGDLDKTASGAADEPVEAYQDDALPASRSSPTSQAMVGMTPEMRRSAANLLRAPSSRFATEHFQRAAQAAATEGKTTSTPGRAGLSFATMFGSPNRRKLTLRDAALAVSGRRSALMATESPSSPVHGVGESDFSPDEDSEGGGGGGEDGVPRRSLAAVLPVPSHAAGGGGHGASRLALRAKPSATPGGFANMFAVGGNGANRAMPSKSSRNLLAAAAGGQGHHGSGMLASAALHTDVRTMLVQMAAMGQALEQQTRLIGQLAKQVRTLSKQLDAIAPALRDVDDVSVVSASASRQEDAHFHLTTTGAVLAPAPSAAHTTGAGHGGSALGSFLSMLGHKAPTHPDPADPSSAQHAHNHPPVSSTAASLATTEPHIAHPSLHNTPRRGSHPDPAMHGVHTHAHTGGRSSGASQSAAERSLFHVQPAEVPPVDEDQIQQFEG